MYEYEVLLTNGERRFIFGYSFNNACERAWLKPVDIKRVLYQVYVD